MKKLKTFKRKNKMISNFIKILIKKWKLRLIN